MAALEIIDAELVRSPFAGSMHSKHSDTDLTSLYPIHTPAERAAALLLLSPSTHDVCLGAGWIDTDSSPPLRPSSCSSSSSSPSTPGEPVEAEESEALLVRSCSQGWSLSFELSAHRLPTAGADEAVVRNIAVGLNPVDWKSVSYNFGIPAFPWILGRDIAAEIVQPPQNNAAGWKVGDRVWTCADSRHMRAGGYQRFSVHNTQTLAKLPDHIPDQEAATLGTGLVTAAVALFAFFKLRSNPVNKGLEDQLDSLQISDDDWIL